MYTYFPVEIAQQHRLEECHSIIVHHVVIPPRAMWYFLSPSRSIFFLFFLFFFVIQNFPQISKLCHFRSILSRRFYREMKRFERLTKTVKRRTLFFPLAIGGGAETDKSRNVGRGLVHTKHVLVVCRCSYTCVRCACRCCRWSINPFTNQHTEAMLYGVVTESFVDNLCY